MPALTGLRTAYWRSRSVLASPGDSVAAALRPWQARLARRNPHRIFAVAIDNPKLGFFANLNLCVELLYYCDGHGLSPHIAFTSPNYRDRHGSPSWFDDFFEHRLLDAGAAARVARGEVPVCTVRNGRDFGFSPAFRRQYCQQVTVAGAHALVTRYIGIRAAITEQVDRFAAQHFGGGPVLAVHFRGTDKRVEAPRVAWDFCRATVANYLDAHPQTQRLFVASDEQAFVDHMAQAFPDLAVCHRDDRFRARGDQAVHMDLAGGDNRAKGEDALVNCLLMARCSALIKSSSLLSAWAAIYNPALPVVLLNRPHREEDLWFPESELVGRSLDGHLPRAP